MVQWLRLHTSTAGGVGSIPGWRTKKTKDTEKDAHAVEGKAIHKTEGMISSQELKGNFVTSRTNSHVYCLLFSQ